MNERIAYRIDKYGRVMGFRKKVNDDELYIKPVTADDFNEVNSVAIFMGPLMDMYREISTHELKTLLDRETGIVVLDVRDTAEYRESHICGAINIPVSRVELDAPGIMDTDDFIVLYCEDSSCAASAVAADKLSTIGYRNAMRYAQGIAAWKGEGLCVEGISIAKAA